MPGPGVTRGREGLRGAQKWVGQEGISQIPTPPGRALWQPQAGLLVSRPLPHPGVWPHCGWTREGRRPEACDSGWGQSLYPCVTLGRFLGWASVSLSVKYRRQDLALFWKRPCFGT